MELLSTAIISIISVFISVFYYYFTSTFNYWRNLNIPYKKPTILFGNFKDVLLFRKSQPEGIKDIYNWFKNERYFGVFRVRTPILIIKDPELIKNIFIKDFSYFANRGIPINSQDTLSQHLFNLEGKNWKSLRSKLTPVFSSAKIKKMFYLLVDCQKIFEKLITDSANSSIEVRELSAKFTIDVIGTCAFGIQINALTDSQSQFHKTVQKLSRPSYKTTLWRMLRTSMPKLYKLFGVQVIDPEVTKFFKDVVSQMIKQRETENHSKRFDFMDLLVDLKNNKNDDTFELNEETIAAQAFVFFVAGYETSSNTIAFCLHELALNPGIQEAARNDIRRAIERNNNELTYEAIQEMNYLDSIVLETLRKYPPAPMLSRKCEYSYQLPDTKINLDAGIRVVIPIYGIHHDPNYYSDPDRFLPDRFNNQNESLRHPYTFLPFGEGPRNCIGMKFAMLQIKVGIISFLKNHCVEVCEKTVVPIRFSRRSLVTSSENGFWLKIQSL